MTDVGIPAPGAGCRLRSSLSTGYEVRDPLATLVDKKAIPEFVNRVNACLEDDQTKDVWADRALGIRVPGYFQRENVDAPGGGN